VELAARGTFRAARKKCCERAANDRTAPAILTVNSPGAESGKVDTLATV